MKALLVCTLLCLTIGIAYADWSAYHGTWAEFHFDISRDGAVVWLDAYLSPYTGLAYYENEFWNFDVIRVSKESKKAIKNIRMDVWAPYLPDFYPVTEWSTWTYLGDAPTPDYNTYYKNIDGWTEDGKKATFLGPLEIREVPQCFGGYYWQARYMWDMENKIYPSEMYGIEWLLKSTQSVRPGIYSTSFHVYYDVEQVQTKKTDLGFKKWFKPGQVIEKRKGTIMCWMSLENATKYEKIRIIDKLPEGWIVPKEGQVKVWGIGKGKKLLNYELKTEQGKLVLSLEDVPFDKILVMFPISYDKSSETHAYMTLTTLEAISGGTIFTDTIATKILVWDTPKGRK